jgi:hypothetical protein
MTLIIRGMVGIQTEISLLMYKVYMLQLILRVRADL